MVLEFYLATRLGRLSPEYDFKLLIKKPYKQKEIYKMITAVDIKLLRNKVLDEIETAESTLVISDDDHTIARQVIAEIPTVLEGVVNGVMPSAEHIARVAITACKDVQFRDFLLGAFTEYESNAVGAWLEIVSGAVKKDYAYPVATVLSTYYYRDDKQEEAAEIVREVLDHNPDYSLAQLLSRVYPVFSPENMQTMAGELHPKVKAIIFEQE